jgi:ankyrin repeat protein
MASASLGLASVVAMILKWGDVEVNLVNPAGKDGGETALFSAVIGNHEPVVAQLVACESVDVNSANAGGVTPIVVAAAEGYEAIVCTLLKCERTDLNIADDIGQTAIFQAILNGHVAIVFKLIECERVDVNATDRLKQTLIFMAAGKGNESIVAKLIECERVDLDVVSDALVSAVMMAANKGFDSIVDMLAEAGAILSSDHRQHNTLHDLASRNSRSPESKAATVAVLKKHGVISDNVPSNFQSKYYFQDGEGKIYLRNVKYQRWLNRRTLLLALYRTYQWSLDNQVLTDARRTLPPDLSDVGKFICQCWFDVAGGGKYEK